MDRILAAQYTTLINTAYSVDIGSSTLNFFDGEGSFFLNARRLWAINSSIG